MQPAKAEPFNVIREERVSLDPHTSLDHYRAWTFLRSGHSAFLDHYLRLRWSSLCFLRSRRSRAHKKSSRQYRAHPSQFSLHFSFSSSLPNCCQIFAVAISAIPAFTRPSKIVQKFLRTFSLSQTAVFTLSQNAVVPICISPELDARRSRQYYCGSRTACGNPSSPTSKSTWIHSLARSSLTGKPNAPSAHRCRRTPHFQCHMPRAELLAQTHLHARGRLRHGGIFRERAQLNSGGLPGVLQRGAT